MNFADELRKGKGLEPQKWSPTSQDRRDVEIILDMLKGAALSRNKTGKSSVKGYLAYAGYDWDRWRLESTEGNLLVEDLGANGFGVKRKGNDDYLKFLQTEISTGLKKLGFHNIYVQPEIVQLYRKEPGYFRDWKIVKYCRDETLKIEFFW